MPSRSSWTARQAQARRMQSRKALSSGCQTLWYLLRTRQLDLDSEEQNAGIWPSRL
jgi:hypothetical protein